MAHHETSVNATEKTPKPRTSLLIWLLCFIVALSVFLYGRFKESKMTAKEVEVEQSERNNNGRMDTTAVTSNFQQTESGSITVDATTVKSKTPFEVKPGENVKVVLSKSKQFHFEIATGDTLYLPDGKRLVEDRFIDGTPIPSTEPDGKLSVELKNLSKAKVTLYIW